MPDIYVAWVGVGVEVWVGAIHRRFKLQFYKHAGLEGCRPVTLMAHPRRFSLTPRTLMGCADRLSSTEGRRTPSVPFRVR